MQRRAIHAAIAATAMVGSTIQARNDIDVDTAAPAHREGSAQHVNRRQAARPRRRRYSSPNPSRRSSSTSVRRAAAYELSAPQAAAMRSVQPFVSLTGRPW